MAAPLTVRAAGIYSATVDGAVTGEAMLRMRTATQGSLIMGTKTWKLTGDATAKRFRGKLGSSKVELRIQNRSFLKGTLDGDTFELTRSVLRPIRARELAQSDAGPRGRLKTFMASVPDYQVEMGDTTTFWYAFGPVLYRGRLDGSARLLGIASDPGPSECLPFMRRALVGDSGQKTQGFLAKLGLTRSYVLVNAFAVALRPGEKAKGLQLLTNNVNVRTWRHGFYDRLVAGGAVEAIVAFGDNAHQAYDMWAPTNPRAAALPVIKVGHPAAVDRDASGHDATLKAWARAVTRLRGMVTPDSDGDAGGPNYGAYFTENDYARIPRRDLPSKAPLFAGDDSWGRAANPQHNNCCERPHPDDSVSLLMTPPAGQGVFLRYRYEDGKLKKTTKKNGRTVATDAFGIPL